MRRGGRGLARRWRRIAGVGEAELVPQARLSGPMPWVIAIMVAMTMIATAGGLALRNTARTAAAEIEGGVTVQIVEPRTDAREQQVTAALAQLGQMRDVESFGRVPQAEVDALIEPWLGGAEAAQAIPVPALIDVRLPAPATAAWIDALRDDLRAAAPSARVDAQSTWLKPVFGALVSLQWLAFALVALLAGALAAAVLLAVRSALGGNRETIEIVHLLGGADAQIARVFQRSIAIDAAGGGLVGVLLALVVILSLGRRFALLGAGMVQGGALGWQDWLALALVPVAAVALAMLTARLTVLRALRKML